MGAGVSVAVFALYNFVCVYFWCGSGWGGAQRGSSSPSLHLATHASSPRPPSAPSVSYTNLTLPQICSV
jgi:hypothetical protein